MDWKSATRKGDGSVAIPERWLHLHYYEALNILFRMENSLRVFVYVVLKNKFKEKWGDAALQTPEGEQSTILTTAAKRLAQAKGFGYLGYEINSPLMYLSSGELTRIVTSEKYWEIFKPFFRGKKDIIKTKLDEIGTVRNALAHFKPLKYDDIELIKQNVKHVFVGIEQCMQEMTQTHRVVPTNTEDQWYRSLSALGSNHCAVKMFQNSTEKWIRMEVEYNCLVLRSSGSGRYRWFILSNLISQAVITSFPALARYCTFMIEGVSAPQVTANNSPDFKKQVSLIFEKSAVVDFYKEISVQMRDLLLKIETETELVREDNLARGQLVDTAQVWSMLREHADGQEWWATETDKLKSGFGEKDPPEYWGEAYLYSSDFIAGSSKYPWMPSDISKYDEIPF